jgi:hypothetical protein
MTAIVFFLLLSQTVVDFESPAVLLANDKAHRVEEWKEQGVTFRLAHAPTKNKGKGLLMFFEHIATGRKGIGSAMALESIPVRATLPTLASKVSVTFWGSTGIPVQLVAYDAAGNKLTEAAVPSLPLRKSPADPEPQIILTVEAKAIAYVEFSGPRPGEFLAAGSLTFQP